MVFNMEALEKKLRQLQPYLEQNQDMKMRRIAGKPQCSAVIFLEGMTDQQLLEQDVIRYLLLAENIRDIREALSSAMLSAQQTPVYTLSEMTEALSSGLTLVLIDGVRGALALDLRDSASRSVGEPVLDKTILGARDGFVESVNTNVSLIRRRLRSNELCMKELNLGSQSQTKTAVLYMENKADPAQVEELLKRLQAMKLPAVLTVGNVQPVISDQKSIFPTLKTVERPDTVCSLLLKGKIAVICDGQPLAMVCPIAFSELFESPNDAAVTKPLGGIMTAVRMICFLLTLTLPALYLSVLNFNRTLLPDQLSAMLIQAESLVPFSLFAELLLVDFLVVLTFEVGISLPTTLGGTIGIFGSIILGQALVSSRFTSEATMLVVIVAAMCCYIIPNYPLTDTARLLRYFVLAAAACFGMVGTGIAVLLILIRLFSLTSLGEPYFRISHPKRKAETLSIQTYKEMHGEK